MKVSLRIGEFPEPSVVWIAKERLPPARIVSKFLEINSDKLVDSFTRWISYSASIARKPLPGQVGFGRLNVHGTVRTEPGGIGPFGIMNSQELQSSFSFYEFLF